MEVTLLQDDYGRRRGCVGLTNRTHIMSQEAYPYKPFGNYVEDKIDIKIHLGEDEHGICIKAFESNLLFTVEGNYETVAKMWRFDYTESTPVFTVKMTEKIDDEIVYIIQEHNVLKLKRISVSGVFPGYPGQDRITVTHAGIALDERFPFVEGETRSSGFQWTIFEHITDHLTLVRWSSLAFCPVNAHGPLSLLDTASSFRVAVNLNDSDEMIVVRIRSVAAVSFEKLVWSFRQRLNHFQSTSSRGI
ncbi:hypothetical protein AC1031_016756 [Aphanomyces cochlioides]|nr:hypothetical protein AC1031_016756 [Aphanomyces cochlioides]